MCVYMYIYVYNVCVYTQYHIAFRKLLFREFKAKWIKKSLHMNMQISLTPEITGKLGGPQSTV